MSLKAHAFDSPESTSKMVWLDWSTSQRRPAQSISIPAPPKSRSPGRGCPFCVTLNPPTTDMPSSTSKTKTSSVACGGAPWFVSAKRWPVRLLKASPEMGIATKVESRTFPAPSTW